ncbi:MAG: RNA polymerase sigma factor [Alphaproteobacteria bacterium]|nr:RNA polymerase sigma factor [Alphaproteobacteria bacterium]MCW5741654.1 RNA polymerase sigma factor [Alphaproteobacteria bacterium]
MAVPDARRLDYTDMEEAELVRRTRAGEREAFRAIMQRHNQRLFRIARSIAREETDAEDILQESYLRAFVGIETFRGESSLLTWLTRIVINEANGRLRKRRNLVGVEQIEAAQGRGADVIMFPHGETSMTPEQDAARTQIRHLLESAIDGLPDGFRVVFVMREIEDCSVAETAESLGIPEETVKTRLFRARRLLRSALNDRITSTVHDAFPFLGRRCERITEAVLARLDARDQSPE